MSRVRRTLQWSAIGGVALVALWAFYRSSAQVAEAGPEIASSRQLLILLTLAIIILALGFVAVLIRNLVRLIVDRKRGILGARLRTKLVFFFLALVLFPAFLLSFGAGAVIKQTVEGLLRTQVEEVSRQAKEIAKETGRREEQRLLDHARQLADELADDASGDAGAAHLAVARWRQREGFELAALVRGNRVVQEVTAERSGAPIPLTAAAQNAIVRVGAVAGRSASAVFDSTPLGQGVLLLAGAPVDPARPERGAAVVGAVMRSDLKVRLDAIEAAERAYLEMRRDRRELLRLYYSLIALVGLTIVFVASWIGFYLSRRITVPLGQMAAASREISEGNLGVRVLTNVGDEVGQLVEAFNEMAGQLQESREVITRNTAELRRSNQALDERRRYVETLVAQLSTAVVSLDRNGIVTTANPAVGSMLGMAVKPGDPFRETLEAAGLTPLSRLLEDVAARGGQQARRDLLLDRRGSPVAAAVQVSPLRGAAGADLGTLVMIEDLTDLLEAQRAAAWREVARRIAHEIKNPLTPIQLAAQRLRKKFDESAPDLPDVVRDATAIIEREVAGLKTLVDEFSTYARMPAAAPSPVDAGEIIRSVVALYGVHPGVQWDVAIDPELSIVRVDKDQIRRALINLIDNAIAAMGGVGALKIEAAPYAGAGSLRLTIADRGPGVAPADRDKLFTPYFSTKPRGTGLGLAIVQRIVVEHRGTIRIEDNPGGGARFIVEIPADRGAEGARAAGPHAVAGGGADGR